MISKDKIDTVQKRMNKLRIYRDDLIEKFIRGSGPGGQKINKTSSTVYLKHLPSGMEVTCQQTRSRAQNRILALEELCDKIERDLAQQKQKEIHEKEKLRRQKYFRTKKEKEKVLQNKKRRKFVKSLRLARKEDE
jgi:protein subunit release factor B